MSFQQSSDLQQQMYQFIVTYINKEQMPPTNREIGQALGITSTAHVNYHLVKLESKGIIEREKKKSRGIKLTKPQVGVPIRGTIAAGTPLNIFPDTLEVLPVNIAHQDENTFALVVRGWSMIDDHICDGDYVIIRPQSTCQNGDIIVATHIQGGICGSATLKRFFQEHKGVRLQPANTEIEPIFISKHMWDSEWCIQGKVVSIHRQLLNQ